MNIAIDPHGYQPEAIVALDKYKYNRVLIGMEGVVAAPPQDGYLCSQLDALDIVIGEVKKIIDLLEEGLKYPNVRNSVLCKRQDHLGNGCHRENQFKFAMKHDAAAIQ